MVSIGTTMIGRGLRRLDMVGGSAIVLTVNAIVFSGIAGVGALFLIFFFADETSTWHRLWPLVAGWAVVTALGAANAYATVRFARRPHEMPRVSDGVIALVTAALAGAWLILPSAASPVAVFTAAPFAFANVAAAAILFRAAHAPAPVAEFPPFTPSDDDFSGITEMSGGEDGLGADPADRGAELTATTKAGTATGAGQFAADEAGANRLGLGAAGADRRGIGTAGLVIESSGAFRGLRGRAALTSLGGIQPSRRARMKARR